MKLKLAPFCSFLSGLLSDVHFEKLWRLVLICTPQAMERGVKVLDCIPPYDTHKIGVVYVAKGQVRDFSQPL